ncbi:hypothetical protein ACIF9R_20785 [Streptomyces sp. NPDC086080]|uniref:hypothetical protein n=1 Tax=Streptomyces sp. NPDC086080 TaxID=3365748 RepID=UPI0037CD16D1
MIITDWQARHGLTAAEHQAEFDRFTGRGYRLLKIAGYERGRHPALRQYPGGPGGGAPGRPATVSRPTTTRQR